MVDQGDDPESTIQAFVNKAGLPFMDRSLLRRALTHRSYLNEHTDALEDNERLEFLGDAVLDFLVGAWLYHRFPDMKEGDLTRLRSALVRTEQLAHFAGEIGLGEVMLLGHGEREGGGRNRPTLLCGTFEALVGALFLDKGIPAVLQFVEPMIEMSTDDIITERKDQDPKSQLQEWAQSQGFGSPIYRIVASEGPEHQKYFTVEVLVNAQVFGSGRGPSKQSAAKDAARRGLQRSELTENRSSKPGVGS